MAVSLDGSNDRIADYTFWLAVFSACLFGVAVIQAIFLYRSNQVAATAANAAKASAEALVAADLPLVRLSKLVFSRFGGADPLDNSKAAFVTIGFTNFGGKAARVTEYCVEMESAQDLPACPAYKTISKVFSDQIVVRADTEYVFPIMPYVDVGGAGLAEVLAHKKRFWIYGYIAYLDHLDREHKTGFIAWWNNYGAGIGRFPDEAISRGETFMVCRKEHYTYST